MWNYGQKWITSSDEIVHMAGDEAMLLRKLKENYLILFNLRDSLWRLQARNVKRLFENLEDHEKYAYICRNMNNVNRHIRCFILEYMLEQKSKAVAIEKMWNPDDVLFSMKYIELIGKTRSKNHVTFLFGEFGKLFRKYELKENIPREFLSPGASQLIHGWRVAVLTLSLENVIHNIGDIRLLIVEYLETHPNYRGKILLLGMLCQQTLAARARSLQEDSIDQRVIRFLEDTSTSSSERNTVRNEAMRILRGLK